MRFTFIAERCSDLPVAASCRVMKVTTSGFYEWRHRQSDPCAAGATDHALTDTIVEIHRQSRGTYGSAAGACRAAPRRRHPRRSQARRAADAPRRHRRRLSASRDEGARDVIHKPTPSDDLVNRRFSVDGPDRLWVSDITEHPTDGGKVYLAVVLDAWSRRVVGWSIADHLRAELVVDALQMAIWRRNRPDGTDRAFRSRHPIHELGVRPTAPRCRAARLDGQRRRRVRQRGRRELLRHPATRAPRPPPLGDTRRARVRDVRMDRVLLQPATAGTRPSGCSAPSTTRPPHAA